jgi:hypothetical protein
MSNQEGEPTGSPSWLGQYFPGKLSSDFFAVEHHRYKKFSKLYRIAYMFSNFLICLEIIMIQPLSPLANCSEYHTQIEARLRGSAHLCVFFLNKTTIYKKNFRLASSLLSIL